MLDIQSEISQLKPNLVWQFFAKICSIPRPSKHEEALAQEIIQWATKQDLTVFRDKIGNVIIKKPATEGMENRKVVALQAHLDMVPQKNEDTVHDFTKDPIDAYIDGGWVTARGTTLGADNGMGLSACLAVLASTDISHGPLEVLFTIDEEAGMTGAANLEPGLLDAEILLNTDSEQEGEVYVGCAGGIDCEITLPLIQESLDSSFINYRIFLKGLRGGHSGVDIHLGRGNANQLLNRFLAQYADELNLKIIEFKGGSLRNAIPREASVQCAIPATHVDKLHAAVNTFLHCIQSELSVVEPNINMAAVESEQRYNQCWSAETQDTFIHLINVHPNGVERMSDDISGVVETSLNLGVISSNESHISVISLIRSLIDSGKEQLEGRLISLAHLCNAEIKLSGEYPGWKPDPDSDIMAIFRSLYEDIYGHKPNIMVIHAGLECGLFKKPYPDLDMISFGPTIKYPHSPDEKVEIETVNQFWQQLVKTLENIPEK
ncbi:aminoacyl-histidine dipeptidase [Vibrio viridaestus]|uniref:Cytosol non-specific dipeptidase n=1 Tax=Vibrio viridaestus TaxID=2487322 RepID=A0A3N9TJ89_9VIBR|nr:aminoacyl-histidine dipeptidase [Vibrio viridaestus]RQW63923.1 aminoacyl-histidine dipeptidase [Vibrio viridaestus]